MTSLSRQQATIEHPVTVSGFGYWSGKDVRVQFRAAPAGTGIVFVRQDIAGTPAIPASVAYRTDMPLRTSLCVNSHRIEMIEHIMSALAGLQIDNCQVCVDGVEMPGLDGSCLDFVRALEKAGRVTQEAVRNRFVVRSSLRVENEKGWIEVTPSLDHTTKYKYSLDFSAEPAIGKQEFEFQVGTQSFASEVAPARTFITAQVAKELKAQGLGARVTYNDLLVFDENGPIENQLRFSNECARHKLLDLVGDLSLAGFDTIGNIHSCRGGHALNAKLVEQLLLHARLTVPARQVA